MTNKIQEEWRDVPGYEFLLQVSNLGNVRSLRFNKPKLLSKQTNRNGYEFITSFYWGVQKRLLVHRLVALAFLPNPNNYPVINHKDEKKTNNCVDNLEWCSHQYNVNYGTRTERARQKLMCNYYNEKPNNLNTFTDHRARP